MDHLIEKTIGKQDIYKGRIISLQLEDVLLPNGEQSKREVVKHPGAVGIIPITADGKIVMVRQYRKALEKVIIEIPAGKLDLNEEPLLCAKRELQEETGYVSDSMEFIVSFYTSPGFADELIYIYVAEGLTKREISLDADEFLDVLEISLEEAEQMIQEEKIHDAKTIYAVQYMRMLQNR
ncbi:ADP-ribose pyrophosphatase [Alkalihalobacillus alcalophilus ATCC 27647 = CGMCC 1.3604]|uniref:ADP-ribose pyrophosphatase n=1 Tax=Alkalihalobacillus alcalophilus ATCC 27647 = CGMCC 1.3604 TaxID=1218173 RepID=A0A094XAA3_ALKAL|nr:NUDIX hydrolase [Alkalihalobacillus alcalophilus]KGA95695.1 ADP-ribose pyrophosphatase [Alkalihalobacillus alcalophilus ATCC 27647 = CGMCC 1.3604]MED1564119.1 NUDIX hydrolase [Alkalihalobacillus alcalophilus]THG90595.1 ADP-ribose pyrophosphatase [Alkalihalobacillus alcalophilus ATCC 27647 = CGMCC 1.3604]